MQFRTRGRLVYACSEHNRDGENARACDRRERNVPDPRQEFSTMGFAFGPVQRLSFFKCNHGADQPWPGCHECETWSQLPLLRSLWATNAKFSFVNWKQRTASGSPRKFSTVTLRDLCRWIGLLMEAQGTIPGTAILESRIGGFGVKRGTLKATWALIRDNANSLSIRMQRAQYSGDRIE
jgi:hypothetical protein